MTDTPNEMDTIDAIARALTAESPAHWSEVTATYRVIPSYAELDAEVVLPSGEPAQVDWLPDGLAELLRHAAASDVSARQGRATPLAFLITPEGRFSTDFDYGQTEPAWSIPVNAEIYARGPGRVPALVHVHPRLAPREDWLDRPLRPRPQSQLTVLVSPPVFWRLEHRRAVSRNACKAGLVLLADQANWRASSYPVTGAKRTPAG